MSTPQTFLFPGRRLIWFSNGAASAVAAKLTLELFPDAEVINCDMRKDEHPDNARFRGDVERWIGKPVKLISNPLFQSVDDVFEARKYMSGPDGAPCTTEMKKVPRFNYQWVEDIHVFGFTLDETMPGCRRADRDRIRRIEEENHELRFEWILRDRGITKADTLRIVAEAGIDLPVLYKLGYKNNNCLGCVKATSPAYWNAVRRDFPATFAKRCEQSRRIGCQLVRYKGVRIFLDELPADAGEVVVEDLSCGPQCVVPA